MVQTIQEKNYQFFMETDVSSYIGEWVAICEDKILAHSKNVKEAVSKAKEISKGKKFLIARIPNKEAMIF